MDTSALPTAAELRDELRSRVFRHFAPSSAELLGYRLQPFTLWHWRTLDVLQNPFAPDSLAERWEDSDLAVAIRICSLPPGSAEAFDFPATDQRRLRFELGKARELITLHGLSLQEYIADACKGPACWQAAGGIPIRCPAWLYLSARLIKAGWTERDAWAKSPGEARCWIAALDLAGGGCDFLDENDVLTALEAGHSMEDIGLG